MRKYIIYRHTSPSGKVYIGQTCVSTAKRWGKDGCRYLRYKNGKPCNPIFKLAIEKYGWENFQHEVLFHGCSKELADKLEMAFIKYYKDLGMSYNVTLGGEGTVRHATEEERKAARRATCKKYNENMSEEVKARIIESARQRYAEDIEASRAKARDWRNSEAGKKWYQSHKDERKEYSKEYRQKNAERCKERSRQNYMANREKRINGIRIWRQSKRDDPEYQAKLKEQRRLYRQTHKEQRLEYQRQYRKLHAEEVKLKRHQAYLEGRG